MAVHIKSLNGDTTFYLTFTPPSAPAKASCPDLYPGAFTILIDPWISGAAKILSSAFSTTSIKSDPCIKSLADIKEPDVILITQDKPDHCHEATLKQLPPDTYSMILATPAAARKIRSWNYFDSGAIYSIPKFNERRADSVFRIEIPPLAMGIGSPGEVTISHIPAKWDLTGLHHAFGITYRPPWSVLSAKVDFYRDLPPTPPASPQSIRTLNSTAKTLSPSPHNNREKTISLLYSPHGVTYDIIRPYAQTHLISEGAFPLTAMIHSFDRVQNPWYLGGNVAAGFPGGVEIARNLLPRAWVGAHDAEKEAKGLSVKQIKTDHFSEEEIMGILVEMEDGPKSWSRVQVASLVAGQELRLKGG